VQPDLRLRKRALGGGSVQVKVKVSRGGNWQTERRTGPRSKCKLSALAVRTRKRDGLSLVRAHSPNVLEVAGPLHPNPHHLQSRNARGLLHHRSALSTTLHPKRISNLTSLEHRGILPTELARHGLGHCLNTLL
jgi:hypothetical protein